jgi:hypothetical protein
LAQEAKYISFGDEFVVTHLGEHQGCVARIRVHQIPSFGLGSVSDLKVGGMG